MVTFTYRTTENRKNKKSRKVPNIFIGNLFFVFNFINGIETIS